MPAMTFIAAPIFVDDPAETDAALDRAAQAVALGARMIEWRVDALAAGPETECAAALDDLLARSPAPCIVTCRAGFEGGQCDASESDRARLLAGVAGGDHRPRYVDVELAAAASGEVARVATEIAGAGAGVGAAAARSVRDNLEAADLLVERGKPMIALCMGEYGLMSRVLAPKFGGLITFATGTDAATTAPGQPTIETLRRRYRFDRITTETRVYGVIGWPVAHSWSPDVHNAGFDAVGHDGVYLPLPVPPEYEHFKATVGSLVDHAHLGFRGASVTIPHKQNLIRFVRERGGRIDPLAERIDAANTLVVDDHGALECLNTDAPAVTAAITMSGIEAGAIGRLRAAVIGAGGVARAVVAALADAGATVVVFNRTMEKAQTLADAFDADVIAAAMDDVAADRFDLYVNCTPIGMTGGPAPEESPLPERVKLDDSVTVFDTVYNPVRTPLLREAETRGARVVSGLDMFVAQAALQFERWTGGPAPVEAMRDALATTRTG